MSDYKGNCNLKTIKAYFTVEKRNSGLFSQDFYFSEDMLSCLWNAIFFFSSLSLSSNHSTCPPSLYGTFNCLDVFRLPPLLFLWQASCNWQRTPVSCKLSLLVIVQHVFYISSTMGPFDPRLWYVIVSNATTWWLPLFEPKWWPDLSPFSVVTMLRRPLYLFTFSVTPYWAECSSIHCHRYYLFNSHILSLSLSVQGIQYSHLIVCRCVYVKV